MSAALPRSGEQLKTRSNAGRDNKGMQRTRNQHVSHARLVACGGSCAPLMPSVRWLPSFYEYRKCDDHF
jgi:hypothetical protein